MTLTDGEQGPTEASENEEVALMSPIAGENGASSSSPGQATSRRERRRELAENRQVR